MTKADLVQRVADTIGPGVTKRDCAVVVDSFLNAIKDAMGEHQNIEIRGFGTFKVRERKSRLAQSGRGRPFGVDPSGRPAEPGDTRASRTQSGAAAPGFQNPPGGAS